MYMYVYYLTYCMIVVATVKQDGAKSKYLKIIIGIWNVAVLVVKKKKLYMKCRSIA